MPLGASTTLLTVRTNVRMVTKTESVQESGLLEPTLTTLIHEAILLVRSLARHSLKDFYRTDKPITLGATVDLATLNISIFDISSCKLTLDSDKSAIDIVNRNVYNQMLQLHSFATGQWIATITTVDSGTWSLLVGGAASPSGAATLAYERNPAKVTTDANVLDIPDHLIPITVDFASLAVWRKLKQQPPQDVSQRVRGFIEEQLRDEKLKTEKA
jgi:hypothetical protein